MMKNCHRRILRFLSDKRAISEVISATMMAGMVITLSFVVFAWSQGLSSNYTSQYSQTVTSEVNKLKEKLVFEYIYYNATPNKLSIYLLNCGTIDDVAILNVYVSNSSWVQIFSSPTLKLFSGSPVPDQYLDRGDQRRIDLSLSIHLQSYASYSVKIVTLRGAMFESSFVA